MIDTIPPPDASLPQFLAARARHASDARLAADLIGGLTAAVGTVYWHGPGWYVATSIAICFLAFGAWGIADRELGERAPGDRRTVVRLLAAVRIVAVVVGAGAVAVVAVSTLGFMLGLMIS